MVGVLEKMLSNDCVHPECTLLWERPIGRKIVQNTNKIAVSDTPDIRPLLCKCLIVQVIVGMSRISQKLCVPELEILRIDR